MGVAVAPRMAVRCVVLACQLSAAHALISNGGHVVKNAFISFDLVFEAARSGSIIL